MVVTLTTAAFYGVNCSRWILYERDIGGNVVRCLDSIGGPGRVGPHVVFVLSDPPTVLEFKQHFPESIEVNSMADALISNPNIITEPTPNATAFTVQNTTVTTAGTPVQLPSITVPDGRSLVVISDAKNDVKQVVYVATSSVNAGDPTKRIVLSPGNSVRLFVSNANLVWVDSSANAQKVSAVVEQ